MKTKNGTRTPLGIYLISIFYMFGAVVLLAFLWINPTQASAVIAERHGLPGTTGPWILPVVAGLGLLIAWGLFSLSRWGYLVTIVYLLYFGSVNLYLSTSNPVASYIGNVIWAVLVVVYLIIIRKRFFSSTGQPQSLASS